MLTFLIGCLLVVGGYLIGRIDGRRAGLRQARSLISEEQITNHERSETC